MFEINDQKLPIKVWLDHENEIEAGCLEQARNLASHPAVREYVTLMPDTHRGYGVPIGGVILTEDCIIPNAVGKDIGCGICFVQTNIPARLLNEVTTGSGTLAQTIVGCILRNIPVGFAHQKEKQLSYSLDNARRDLALFPYEVSELMPELEKAYYQMGTMGGGNHFIELQEDVTTGELGIMIHSGSRHLGSKICDYFDRLAIEKSTDIPKEWELAYLSLDSMEGKKYLFWMNVALEFAKENRDQMMETVKSILYNHIKKYTDFTGIKEKMNASCHHNFAAMEPVNGKPYWVTRKGAVRAPKGEFVIIPGAMGVNSYICEGLGNQESFNSCSHGAGRRMGRKEAMRQFPIEETANILKNLGVTLGKPNKKDLSEEAPMAYKNIDVVIAQQRDLINPYKTLKTVAVVKG